MAVQVAAQAAAARTRKLPCEVRLILRNIKTGAQLAADVPLTRRPDRICEGSAIFDGVPFRVELEQIQNRAVGSANSLFQKTRVPIVKDISQWMSDHFEQVKLTITGPSLRLEFVYETSQALPIARGEWSWLDADDVARRLRD